MQNSSDVDNPAASENSPLAGGSSGSALNEVCATRYVSEVNCKCQPVSDAGVDDKEETSVYDSWLPKLAADSSLVGSTDELTDGSGCLSLTEPSSSQVGSIVTVISQNHVTGDCFGNECTAGGLKDGMQNSCGKEKLTDAEVLESAGKRDSQAGGAGSCSLLLVLCVVSFS